MSNQVWSSLRASAPRGQRYFIERSDSNWLNYLRTAAGADGGEPHLCNVLKHISVVQQKKDGRPARFPWLTPVIGSGCAGALSSKQIAEMSSLPAKLAASCPDLDLPDGLSRAELVYDFACGLVEARHSGLTIAPMTQVVSQRSPEFETTLRCVEATALLFRARHAALAYTGTPVRESEFIRLPDGIELQELHYSRLLPARKLLLELSAQADDGAGSQVLKAHQDLFKALLGKVDELPHKKFRVTSRDLGALVEVTWQLMIAPLGIYPGWRDLMTLSAFSSFENELEHDFSVLDTRQARPRFETLSGFEPQLQRVRALMGTATKIAVTETGERERTQFFDALARVLRLQSEYRTAAGSGPFVSAFVTSFDLELELALARQGADFTLVVPYYLTHGPSSESPEHIAPIWLATHVKSSEVLIKETDGCWMSPEFDDNGQYVKGFHPRWRLANITPNTDPLVVVRLVGSPLMPEALMAHPDRAGQLITRPNEQPRKEDVLYVGPDTREPYDEYLSQALPGALKGQGVDISTPIRLDPALVIDEYSGLHRIKTSWTSTFPNALTKADDSTFRYWCGAGLQLDDSLIRLLTAAYLEPLPSERSTAQSGVVVNKSFALPQADFLRWQGFAPVKDDYRVLIPELNHLADHLEQEIANRNDSGVSGKSFLLAHERGDIPFQRAELNRARHIIELTGDST